MLPPAADRSPFHVLFLCTGNSARSILAEFLLRRLDPVRFDVVSAGSTPKPAPHPLALQILENRFRVDVHTARSKSWDEFRDRDFDFVITLCDDAKETCPVWPGQPVLAHWPSPDPAAVTGSPEDQERAFWLVAAQIQRRLELFASLPFEKLDALRLALATRDIGTQEHLDLTEKKP
jgi:protein-tyrosine-phosphatase